MAKNVQQRIQGGLEVGTLFVGKNGAQQSGCVRAGTATVTSAQATAGSAAIATGLTAIAANPVMVLRSGVVTGGATVTASGGTMTVASTSAGYTLTAGDVIHWIAVGS